MYDIYATDLIYEQCTCDKPEINMMIPYAVFHFVLSGEGVINGQKIGKNTVFISFEENHMHYYPDRKNPWSYIYLRLRGDDLKKAFSDHGFSQTLTVLPFADRQALFQLLALHQSLAERGNPDGQKIIANAIFLLFEERKPLPPRHSKPQQHLRRIKQYIDENYYKKITIGEIAACFYLNKNYLRTLFIGQLGISPKQYLQKVRMERAKLLLSTTDESVQLIANSVGYEDPLLFSRMFKRYSAQSPLQYRAAQRK